MLVPVACIRGMGEGETGEFFFFFFVRRLNLKQLPYLRHQLRDSDSCSFSQIWLSWQFQSQRRRWFLSLVTNVSYEHMLFLFIVSFSPSSKRRQGCRLPTSYKEHTTWPRDLAHRKEFVTLWWRYSQLSPCVDALSLILDVKSSSFALSALTQTVYLRFLKFRTLLSKANAMNMLSSDIL